MIFSDGLDFNIPVLQVRSSEFYLASRLETMIVSIIDPVTGVRYNIRFLLDTGSSHSFIKILGVENYHLTVVEKRVIGIQPFGSPPDRRQRDVVSLKFFAKKHPDAAETEHEIKLIAVPHIC